ncbi:MAG: ribonuclease Y [Candidatus Kerfeldbacteria bacterium]|nr:ribonuclease Y [Candidatus Kerfeldbacteria bacterium]
MSLTTILVLALIAGIPGGMIAGYFLRKSWAVREAQSAEAKAQSILADAKQKAKAELIAAQEKSLQVIEDAKQQSAQQQAELNKIQARLEKRESTFDQKLLELENQRSDLNQRTERLTQAKEELKQLREQQLAKLEKIGELTRDEAKRVLMDNTESGMKDELLHRIRKLQAVAQEEWDKKAKELLSTAIQRVASSHSAETTTTIMTLPSDEMKGRIIGREGRNIKAIEQLTGVEIIVDDTPESIIISGFSPIRRQVAKRALERLIADGRIHPARIEEAVEKSKKDLASDMRKAGEEAAYEVGVPGLDPKLIQLLGRMKYRTSYGQNVLRHSIEVAELAAIIAAELGANVALAKKGGLMHDIGKAVDHEIQGSHPQLGYEICKKFNLPEEVAQIALKHHEDLQHSAEGSIVKAADAISGARPGARKDTYEQYVQRLEELEALAKDFPGIDKVYAIQAGREIRVFVNPDRVDDLTATKLARDIANKIEQDLKYPGEIKVTMIREKRVVEYAR